VMYVPKKAQNYEYKPAVTIKDGKTKLKAGKDYEIRYERNTQRDFMYYMMREDEKLRPVAVITAKEGSGYTLQEPLEVTLEIYHMAKLTKNNLEVEIGEAVYNGGQVRPEVTVWFWWNGERCEFTEGRNYTLIYGTNTAAGKNKGSVTIKGLVPMYGGSVTYKFDIIKKDLKYGVSPVIDEK
ncbi:MAG: hypothetical protein K2N77_11755, partial [Lachnospiraceae bacterium]|nr:hypothetical protein [Lachnospiraceae bacterium]